MEMGLESESETNKTLKEKDGKTEKLECQLAGEINPLADAETPTAVEEKDGKKQSKLDGSAMINGATPTGY